MSNYTKSTNFATKDNLPTGDPLKIVKGTEIDTEFNNIATAVSTKTDNASAAITGGSITGITDLAIADGGTGASTATAALNNLLPSQTSNANKYLQTDGTNVSWDAVSLSTSDITGTLPIANGGTGTTSTTFVNLASNVTGTLPVANGGTGVTSSTGTGSNVLSDSPTLVTPTLGTPASVTLTNATGLPISTGISGLGTGVATALAINTPNTGAIVVNGGALGTPSSGTVTNLTGTASININGTVGSSTAYSGAFTSLTTSSTVTINGGTANGVAYLNGSKVLTTGSVIKFDGTNFTSDRSSSTAYSGTNQATWANGIVLNNSATPATGILDSIYFSNNANMQNVFGVAQNASGYGDFVWAGYAGTYTEWMKLTSSGLTLTSNPTLSGGTANGVTYLNGSKVLTSGSALTFDGSTFKVSTSNSAYIGLINGTTKGVRFGADTTGSSIEGVDNTGIASYQPLTVGGSDLRFQTSGSEQMRLTSTGLGIGTSSPSYKLDVAGAARSDSWIGRSNTSAPTADAFIYRPADNTIALGTANTERMRLDSAGNLGLGVTPSAWKSGAKAFQLGATGYASLNEQANGSTSLNFNCYESAANTWTYYVTGVAPTRYTQLSGAHAWFNAPSGTAGNAISFTQSMTLGSNGALLLTCTTTPSSTVSGLQLIGTGGGNISSSGSSTTTYNHWIFKNGNDTVGSISTSGSVTTYAVASDYRLKDITGPITTSGAYIDSLNPVEGTWKADGSTFVGLIAHEVQEASRTQIATGTKDGTEMQAMDYSSSELIANLIAEVKSLRHRVATLEAK